MFSPQQPLSDDYEDDELLDEDKAYSIHSLEKRKINLKVAKEGDDTESVESLMIDNTLSPSPELRSHGNNLNKKSFLKRMASSNIDSNDCSPEEKKQLNSKLARMESYDVRNDDTKEINLVKKSPGMFSQGQKHQMGEGPLDSPKGKSPKSLFSAKPVNKVIQPRK